MSKKTTWPMPTNDDREPKTNSELIRKNADLFEASKRYATVLHRLRVGGKKKAACDVAAECDVPAEEVREAIAFADAVNQIAANCGDGAKALILSDHPRLPAEAVMKINPNAQAHLFHFTERPSFAAFRRRVKVALKGHAQVHEKTIENWTGAGWPI